MRENGVYQIIDTLYQGRKNVIYRAIRQADSRKVILKVLIHEYLTPLDLTRFRQEFDLVKSLNFEGIPSVESFGSFENHYYISFEDDGSISLSRFLSSQVTDISGFLHIAIQLSTILEQLHSRKIIHKDLKPDNMLIHPQQKRVTIIDFGLSTQIQGKAPDLLKQDNWEGSLPYLSPEQSGRMNRPIDFRSDFYTLGISFFEMLTGRLPYQADSPLEWVHTHLAQKMPDLRTFRADVPEMLVKIVHKLASKMAEDRYHSATGLKYDLEKCLQQLQHSGKITPFALGAKDVNRTFRIPAKIYGREQQINELSKTIQHITRESRAEMVVVSGSAGIGKTVFVREAQKQIVAARGFFISGKFDQFNRNIPYQGFSLAFGTLAQQLLAEPESVVSEWKQKLAEALGNNVGIINELVPEFQLILGKSPSPKSLPAEEMMNRFLYAWNAFIKVVATEDHPLMLFLDDLQWADQASLQLLESLFSDSDTRYLCFIGSYRDGETDEWQPVINTIQKIRSRRTVQEIHLSPLTLEPISAMLADTLNHPAEQVQELALLLLQKTDGNPFFLTESLKTLHEEKGVYFDETTATWHWDMRHIQDMDITDNVVDLMVSKIAKCSAQTQENLMLAACIGHSFTLRSLSWLTDKLSLVSLKEAIDQGLIYPTDDNYLLLRDPEQQTLLYQNQANEETKEINAGFRFLHDRVQQAAYSQLPTHRRKSIHLVLGETMIANTRDLEKTERIFDICNHINLGRSLIKDQETRTRYAKLNLIAGQKARNSNAYQPALDLLEKGIELLPPDHWNKTYPLAYQLWLDFAQCLYITGKIDDAKNILQDVLSRSRSRMDKLSVYRSLVDMYTTQQANAKVLEAVKGALSLFRIRLPERPLVTKFRVLADLLKVKFRLRNIPPSAIPNLPLSNDPEHIKLVDIVITAGPSAYISNQDLFAWMVLFELRYAIRLGHTYSSPLSYLGYGMILQKAFGDIDSAYAMYEVALQLNEKMGSPFPTHRLKFTFTHFIKHFAEDVSATAEVFKKLYPIAMETGDLVYTGFFLNNLIWNGAIRGKDLTELCEEGLKYLKILEQQQNIISYDLILTRLQALLILNGRPMLPWRINGVECSMEEKRDQFRKKQSYPPLVFSFISSFQLSCLLDEPQIHLSQILEADKHAPYVSDTHSYADLTTIIALAAYKYYQLNGTNKNKLRQIVNRHRRVMRKRAKTSPANYQCHYLLISALHALLTKKDSQARKGLQETIKLAKNKGLNHILGMARELLSQLYIAADEPDIARFYLRESLYAYQQWGAKRKVEHLLQSYPGLLLDSSSVTNRLDSPSFSQQSSSGSGTDLDLASLFKSATSISSEIVLEKLLPTMIYIAVENAGAQSGYLLLEQDGNLFLNAFYHIEKAEGQLLSNLPLQESNSVPKSIIHYIFRTGTPLVLDNATGDHRFRQDPYFTDKAPKSILCHPLIYQGKLLGVIYLENNLLVKAFGENQIKVLRILSTQIAVSLQNAMLYQDLEKSLDQQIRLTEAYSRFTPKEYLRFLGRESILDAQLGDNHHADMVVLFSDIRSYTTLCETMTPEENFQFMSVYLQRMSGLVSQNDGIIDQLLGDGIMAFFFQPKDALKCAIDMQLDLQQYNRERHKEKKQPVKVGIGLHKGPVIIGIVGDEKRMSITIASDTVNTASRIEGLTKYYGTNILISSAVAHALTGNQKKKTRNLGKVRVKGKNQTLDLWECFAGDPLDSHLNKESNITAFHTAQQHFCKGDFEQAMPIFQKICQNSPHDLPAQMYLQKSITFLDTGTPDGWTGIEEMEIK